ncbi:MAG TPA: hypothetical protein VK436_06040 [Methanocella sp.]|nr:hypothetical protein [Methanocella sp.]
MKQVYKHAILALLVLSAITAAGCTSLPSQNNSQNNTSGTTFKSLVDYNKVHWYEYNATSVSSSEPSGQSGSMKIRADMGVNYNGTTADKYNMTMANVVILNNTSSMIMEEYVDHSTGNILGGRMVMNMNGNVTENSIQPMSSSRGLGTDTSTDMLNIAGNSTLTATGSESVTVPAGTFTATKYTWKDNTAADSVGYIWIASSVPIPVKEMYSSKGTTSELDLKGWG